MGKRHKYSHDYEVVEEKIDTGKSGKAAKNKKKLVYKGTYYAFDVINLSQKKIKWSSLLLMTGIALIFAGTGMLNNDGSREVYVIFPYIFMFLPIFYGLMGTIKMLSVGDKMTHIEYDHSIVRAKKSSVALFILSITCLLGETVFLFANQITNVKSREYLFLSGILLMAGISYLLIQILNCSKVQELERI